MNVAAQQKSFISMTDQQKKLLLFLLIGAIVAIPYFFIIQPQMERADFLRSEIRTLEQRRAILEGHRDKMPEYQVALGEMHLMKNEYFAHYPSELPQEATILFIDATEKRLPITMKQIGLSADTLSPVTSANSANAHAAVMEIASNEPLIEGLNGIKNTTALSYECSYENFKRFLKYIEEYKSRIVIPNMSISFNEETGMVSGSLTLIQYAIDGEGRDRVISKDPFMQLGTPNIFVVH